MPDLAYYLPSADIGQDLEAVRTPDGKPLGITVINPENSDDASDLIFIPAILRGGLLGPSDMVSTFWITMIQVLMMRCILSLGSFCFMIQSVLGGRKLIKD